MEATLKIMRVKSRVKNKISPHGQNAPLLLYTCEVTAMMMIKGFQTSINDEMVDQYPRSRICVVQQDRPEPELNEAYGLAP